MLDQNELDDIAHWVGMTIAIMAVVGEVLGRALVALGPFQGEFPLWAHVAVITAAVLWETAKLGLPLVVMSIVARAIPGALRPPPPPDIAA